MAKAEEKLEETTEEKAPKEKAPAKEVSSEELAQRALEAIEVAKNTGRIKKGVNEVTKAIERGTAKLVAYAKDVQPQEIIMHLPVLAKEKKVPCFAINSKEELGVASGLSLPASAVAVINEGDAKKLIESLKR